MRNIAKWSYQNWNVAFFFVTVLFYVVYMIAFAQIGTGITWEEFNNTWYALFLICFPLSMFVQIMAVVNKKNHRFKCLAGTFLMWFCVQGVTLGGGV